MSGREGPRAADGPRRVLIVEDHPMLREALDALLRSDASLSVVGTEGTIAGALAAVARESPDLVVMDQHLPDGRGTDAAQAIHRRDPTIQVVMRDDLARLLRRQRERQGRELERQRITKELTPRDREILDLMAQGVDTKQIATRTGLSVNTVRGHVQAVIEKLQTHSRLEAVLRSGELGLIRQPPH